MLSQRDPGLLASLKCACRWAGLPDRAGGRNRVTGVIGTLSARRVFRLADVPDVRVVMATLGLACCAMEVESAVRMGLLVEDDREPAEADRTVLLVAGTVTDALVPAVRAVLADLPADTAVVSFGACAGTGGPYWDAPTVTKGVDQLVSVERYIAGCPPRPDALSPDFGRSPFTAGSDHDRGRPR